jgi:hypothetical protein
MILPPHETERFYRVWWVLLRYVNAQRHVMPDMPATAEAGAISLEAAGQLRAALWADEHLRTQFIRENPAALPAADLPLVESWQSRVSGKFFVLKHLKKHSVFLQQLTGEPARAYGVLGLHSPLSEVVGDYLPVLVEAVLLPFDDCIIYDSLLLPYRVTFGPGIRADLNRDYRDAQEHEGVITSLAPRDVNEAEEPQAVQTRNAKLLNDFRKALYQSGLSPKMVEQHVGNIERFADWHVATQQQPRLLRDLVPREVGTFLEAQSDDAKVHKATFTSFKRFLRFLWDTGRMDPKTHCDFQDIVRLFRR